MVPFDMLGMVSYQCELLSVRHLFQIFDFKFAVTLKTGLRFREGR